MRRSITHRPKSAPLLQHLPQTPRLLLPLLSLQARCLVVRFVGGVMLANLVSRFAVSLISSITWFLSVHSGR